MQELSRQIELSLGFGELRETLNNFEEGKIWKANGETRWRESVGNQLHAIREEDSRNDSGAAISRDFGNDWDQITLPEQQEADTDEKASGDVELGGAHSSQLAISKW